MKHLFGMKHLLTLLLLTTFSSAFDIHLTLADIKSSHGVLYIGLYKNAKNFGKVTKTFRKKRIMARKGTRKTVFRHLPKGTYGISVFHDENNNGILDTNLLGLPKEGYGFSKNRRFAFRAATFDESSFGLTKDQTIQIKIGY